MKCMKALYDKRKALHLCVSCGAALDFSDNHVRCPKCLEAHNDRLRLNPKKPETNPNEKLDRMAKEAHDRGISYGQLQAEETIERVRAASKARRTLESWGRGALI